ncbi:MAG: anhydro-N-acetylmuramic acid kinase [Gammaproteobacteria bacterium]
MSKYYIGLISGTSMDAIDAVLASFPEGGCEIHATHSHAMSEETLAALRHLVAHPKEAGLHRLGMLDTALGREFAAAALALIDSSKVSPDQVHAIGSHGQTVYHSPASEAPFSMQIGDPNIIAVDTGIQTVADFRRRDIALGGEGAPLVPAFHQAMFSDPVEPHAVLNIGGIANVTVLRPGTAVAGFDTGPGNTLMDAWIRLNRGKPYDADGGWAASAEVDESLLNAFMAHPFFARPWPKSTGIEDFNMEWLQRILDQLSQPREPETVQATLCRFSARTAAQAIDRACPEPGKLFLCGGGAHNRTLVSQIGEELPGWQIESTDALGIGIDWVEAAAFAWLAYRNLAGLPGNLPDVTGASRKAVLGNVFRG